MDLNDLQKNWDELGRTRPLNAILTSRKDWELDNFFNIGINEIDHIMTIIKSLVIEKKCSIKYGRALDFGCGVGRVTQALAKYFNEVIGVDIAPSMIELANKYNKYGDGNGNRCKYYLNELDNLHIFSDNTFDFIYSMIVLQHIEPIYTKNYIREFIRVMAKDGLLVFQLPSEKSDGSNIRDKVIKGYTPFPMIEMYGIRQKEVIELIEENNARVIHVVKDNSAGPAYNGYRYYVAKN